MAELGVRFDVSRVLANRIIDDYRFKPSFLVKVRAKEQIYEERIERVTETVQNLIEQKSQVWSGCADVDVV